MDAQIGGLAPLLGPPSMATGPSGDTGTRAAADRVLPRRVCIRDLEAEMHIAGIGGGLRIGAAPGDLVIVEKLEDHAAGQVDECRLDRHVGIADIRPR